MNKSDDNTMYFYSTINVQAIAYIVKQRNWKLPELSFNQVQNLIERLHTNKSPDYFGFLMKNINTSFQFIEHGVPAEELVGIGFTLANIIVSENVPWQ